jgi:hypothetical protein
MHAIEYDSLHDEIVVTSPLAQAILVFRGGATGEEAPIRVIQGPRTQLVGSDYAAIDRLAVDPVHDEILVPVSSHSILVFPRSGNGDVAPERIIHGSDTQLQFDGRGGMPVAVDSTHNLIIAGWSGRGNLVVDGRSVSPEPGGPQKYGALLIFDRTANGNVKPRAVIQGPKADVGRPGQIQVFNGRIAASNDVSVGVWSINDNGDVPARWRIALPVDGFTPRPRGLALNAKHKEIYIPDNGLNSILTYYFPEMF